MRAFCYILLLGVLSMATAQLSTQPIAASQKIASSSTPSSRISKNSLPFWDDFSITADGLPDQLRIWGTDTTLQWGDSTQGVLVNSTLAINPPSYKVVTFDGLNENGQFYADGNGLTDQLYSNFLDLSALTANDDIYMSFYWQAGGNVERPDDKDSIRLQFYNVTADTTGGQPWQSIWGQAGLDSLRTDIFYQEFIPLGEQFFMIPPDSGFSPSGVKTDLLMPGTWTGFILTAIEQMKTSIMKT